MKKIINILDRLELSLSKYESTLKNLFRFALIYTIASTGQQLVYTIEAADLHDELSLISSGMAEVKDSLDSIATEILSK